MKYLLSLMAVLSLGMMGVSPDHPAKFVAKAQSLTPIPIVQTTPAAIVETRVVHSSYQAPEAPTGVTGGSGYVSGGSNCVACVRAMTGRSQNGNAGTWSASHSIPHVGDIMIFRPGQQGAGGSGHVGVVVGINGNQIQLAHCNWGGGQTTFFSTGLFW